MGDRIEPLNASEQAWVTSNLARATELGRKYGGDPADSTAPSLEALDAIWSAFAAHLRESGGDPNFLINMVGIAFGQRLVDELGFSWGLITDEYGTNIAVHAQPFDMVVYPCTLIAKRWRSGEVDFIAGLYSVMSADIRHTRTHGG